MRCRLCGINRVVKRIALWLLAAGLSLSSVLPASAEEHVIGWVEKVYLPAADVTVKAKIDSGALTSSIQASDIERFTKDGKKWVRFTLPLEDANSKERVSKVIERPFYRRVKIYGAGGEDHRLVVKLKLCIGDQWLYEQFTLSARANKNYGVLIGRRTLEHIGLLDVTKTFTTQPHCR